MKLIYSSNHSLMIILVSIGSICAISLQQDLSLNLRQKQALDKFRDQVKPLLYKDYMNTDIYLIRWLRAKNFNVNNAEAMLKENLRWRQEHSIDDIQSEDFTDMYLDYPATLDTYDKEGRPIIVLDVNAWDIRRAVLSGKGQRLLRFMDMLMDNVTMQVFEKQQMGLSVSQWIALANGMPLWIQFLSSVENHFHGWLDELIVIEGATCEKSSVAVHSIFELLRQFLSRHTQDALHIFGTNKSQWMRYLDQRISREERRPAYGGTKPAIERD